MPDEQAGFKKAEELEIKLPTSKLDHRKSKEITEKKNLFLLLEILHVDHNKLENS